MTKYIDVARILLEAETILSIGSASLYYDQDQPVDKDWNNLPYIPATSLAGYIRSRLEDPKVIMGDDKTEDSDQPKGSILNISDGLLYNGEKVFETISNKDLENDDFFNRYLHLPTRQHTAINQYGSALEGSKFDNEFVYKGSRFKLEISLELEAKDDEIWNEVIHTLFRNDFYLGSGETNGYGKLKPIEIKEKTYDLSSKDDLDDYLDLSPTLNGDFDGKDFKTDSTSITSNKNTYQTETFSLSGEKAFFHFGAEFGDEDVDDANYKETVVYWNNNKHSFELEAVIPGSSIKGALAHRIEFYANKYDDKSIEKQLGFEFNSEAYKETLPDSIEELLVMQENLENTKVHLQENKEIVHNIKSDVTKAIFGTAKDDKEGCVGQLIIEDIYFKKDDYKEIIFRHNSIDRYTGGTITSALFDEKVLILGEITFSVKHKKNVWEEQALQRAISDLKSGNLAIGGKTSKGHGMFYNKNNEV